MSVHQLPQKTIYADDFHNKVYSFPVDSVLNTESTPGRLLISTSEGYLLVDPLTDQPKQELSLPYRKQTDGSWAAQGMITLLSCEEEFGEGLVRLQNALAGTTTLIIRSESTELERVSKKALAVDKSALTFSTTSPGTPKYAVLMISSPDSEPITVTSDSPDYFQLASDKYPKFSSTLTLQPAPMGVYVHVRYGASNSGIHYGQLIIQNTYDAKTVSLEGRSTRFLPTRSTRSVYRVPKSAKVSNSPKKIAFGLGSVILLGLLWLGYTNRMMLSSVFNETEKQSIQPQRALSPAVVADKNSAAKRTVSSSTVMYRRPDKASAKLAVEKRTDTPLPSNQSETSSAVTTSPQAVQSVNRKPEPASKPINEAVGRQLNQRPKSTRGEESELEKELNQTPHK